VLGESVSFGEIESSCINYASQSGRGFTFSFASSWTVVNSTQEDNGVITLSLPINIDLFGEKMTFGMEKLQSNMSPSDCSKQAIRILSTTLQEFHLIDSNPYVITDTLWGENCVYS
jgi:hypothetical protein